jgi:hypothetical protein
VLYDRYPLEGVRLADRMVDGPRIRAGQNGNGGSGKGSRKLARQMARQMAEREHRYYQMITPPNHIFVLQAAPDLIHLRKPDHNPEQLLAKSQAFSTMDRQALQITDIATDQPLDQVLLQIRTRIWQLL